MRYEEPKPITHAERHRWNGYNSFRDNPLPTIEESMTLLAFANGVAEVKSVTRISGDFNGMRIETEKFNGNYSGARLLISFLGHSTLLNL